MLVFEDIHWADPSLLDLIELLAARLHGCPIVLLTLARPELLDTRPGWGGGLAGVHLAAAAAAGRRRGHGARLQRAARDRGERAPAARRRCSRRWPRATRCSSSSWRRPWPSARPNRADALPTTIRGIVAARLDALPPGERAVLLDAAVIGQGVLARAGGTGDRGCRDARRHAGRARAPRPDPPRGGVGDRGRAAVQLPAHADPRRRLRHAAAHAAPGAARRPGRATSSRRRRRRARRWPRWRATGARPATATALCATSWRPPRRPERGWAKERAVTLYKEALELVPESAAERARDLRRRLALVYQPAGTSSRRCVDQRRGRRQAWLSDVGESSGLTSPAISWIDVDHVTRPARVACSRTIASSGRVVDAERADASRRR